MALMYVNLLTRGNINLIFFFLFQFNLKLRILNETSLTYFIRSFLDKLKEIREIFASHNYVKHRLRIQLHQIEKFKIATNRIIKKNRNFLTYFFGFLNFLSEHAKLLCTGLLLLRLISYIRIEANYVFIIYLLNFSKS